MLAYSEALEARRFLSVSLMGVKAPPATIAADQAAIVEARAIIPRDMAVWAAQLRVDHATVPAVSASGKASINAAEQALRDARGNPVSTQIARGELLIAKGNAKNALDAAKSQIKIDVGLSKVSLAANKRALAEAILQLRQDRVAR
ncbi:MAG TPA: hypothetical protein VIM11_18865 [Tepidisphaeraceae bacterium]|jgi:hypothetical protein